MKAGDLIKIHKFHKPYVGVILEKYEIEPYWKVHLSGGEKGNHCLLIEPEHIEVISESGRFSKS